MRTTPFLLGFLFASAFIAFVPDADAREVACVQLKNNGCEGLVCVDKDLDGRIEGNECVIVYCLHGCCGQPCPPPQWD